MPHTRQERITAATTTTTTTTTRMPPGRLSGVWRVQVPLKHAGHITATGEHSGLMSGQVIGRATMEMNLA